MNKALHFIFILLGAGTMFAQSPPHASTEEVAAWIEQLAASKVRLRDEAQQALAQMLDAEPQIRAAMASHASEEARLRLKRILKGFRDGLWALEAQQGEVMTGSDRGPLRASPDGKHLANLYPRGIDIVETDDLVTVRTQGRSTTGVLTLRMLAWSQDGRRLAFSNQSGAVMVEDETGKRLLTVPVETRKVTVTANGAPREVTQNAPAAAAEFLPGTHDLLVFSGAGLTLHAEGVTNPRRLSVAQIFPETTRPLQAQSMALSRDGKAVGLAFEVPGPEEDLVAMIALPALTVSWVSRISVTPRWIAVNHDGSEALVAMRERGVVRCAADAPLAVTISRSIDDLTSVAYAPDYKSAFITSARPNAPLRQLSLPDGEEIWTAPPAPTGCYHLTLLGNDRLAAKTFDNRILIWKKRVSSSTP